MRNVSALDALFRRPVRGFLRNARAAEKVWYVSELARRMGVPSSSLRVSFKNHNVGY